MTTTCPNCDQPSSSTVCRCCGYNIDTVSVPMPAPTPLSNCHRAEIFYVQEQAFCSECRNPCEGVENGKPVPNERDVRNLIITSVADALEVIQELQSKVEKYQKKCNGHDFDSVVALWENAHIEMVQLQSANEELKKQLEQEKIWKVEDPRMLREQMRVHDVAYQHLFDENAELKAAIVKKDEALRNTLTMLTSDHVEFSGVPFLKERQDEIIEALSPTITHLSPPSLPETRETPETDAVTKFENEKSSGQLVYEYKRLAKKLEKENIFNRSGYSFLNLKVKELEHQCSDLVRDKERLDWLELNCLRTAIRYNYGGDIVDLFGTYKGKTHRQIATLRQAIDKALLTTTPQKP